MSRMVYNVQSLLVMYCFVKQIHDSVQCMVETLRFADTSGLIALSGPHVYGTHSLSTPLVDACSLLGPTLHAVPPVTTHRAYRERVPSVKHPLQYAHLHGRLMVSCGFVVKLIRELLALKGPARSFLCRSRRVRMCADSIMIDNAY